MPFSSTPVFVSPGDTVEIRYPTPDTWNTNITFQVRIGEGIDNVTVGTKLPDAQPNFFQFTDQQASTNPNAILPGDFTSTIQKNTTYYSAPIQVSGIELRVPIRISSSASGPKSPSFPNLNQAAYSINNGPYITEANSFVPVSGTTTVDSKTITGVNTAGLAVGMYVISDRITGEILNISGTTVTVVEPASSSGTTTGNAYFTVKSGDTVRCRIVTEDWYTTNTNVTITISDNYWKSGDELSDTWSITTRAQDQTISTLNNSTFNDFIDVRASDFGTYKTTSISIIGIDDDAVLEATSTGDMEISLDQSNWSQNIQDLTLGDLVYVRNFIGADYTTKTTGSLTIFANPGDTLAGGFENNNPGTFGTGTFAVTQITGTTTDNQQIWTEVDRYPDPISLSPIFTFSDDLPFLDALSVGEGYVLDQIYTTTSTNGVGAGLTVRATFIGPSGALAEVEIVERGSGYTENEILNINGGSVTAQFIIKQYRKVIVSSSNVINNAEPNRYYYVDIPISGLGVEYNANDYSDLEQPYVTSGSTPTLPIIGIGGTVEIEVQVIQGSGRIRKNNAGEWVTALFVQNGDTLNFRQQTSSDFDSTLQSAIQFLGPPDAGPSGNPTEGPNPPIPSDLADTITLKTRKARVVPYDFRAEPNFNSTPGAFVIATIDIDGLDEDTTISVVSTDPPAINAQVSNDGFIFSTAATLTPSSTQAFIGITSGASGEVRRVTYRIGLGNDFVEDTFVVRTTKEDYSYDLKDPGFDGIFIFPQWADEIDLYMLGAGGGDGGSDLPASYGGIGAPGNILVGTLNLPASEWPDPTFRQVRIVSPDAGTNGQNFSQGATGGIGGFGYATGGDGGQGSSTEYSGGGGGGGGAAMIAILEEDGETIHKILAVCGGGGGGGGAGADTFIQTDEQNGNRGLGGGTLESYVSLEETIDLTGNPGVTSLTQGGGGGGAGGGWGSPGNTNNQLFDEFGGLIGTTDLDAQGGTGGGWSYDSSLFSIDESILSPSENGAARGNGGYILVAWPPQDTVADPFNFTSRVDTRPSTAYESTIEQITGITGFITVNVTSNATLQGIRRGSSPTDILNQEFASSVTVSNEDYIQLQIITGGQYFQTYTVSVDAGDTPTVNWTVTTGGPPDSDPSFFSFNPVFDAPVSTLIESEQIDIGGINVEVKVTASDGAEIRIGTAEVPGVYSYTPWITSDPGDPITSQASIYGGQRLQVRILSSPSFLTTVQTSVAVGNGTPVVWEVTTQEEADTVPDTVIFQPLSNQDPLTEVFSNYQEITGISEDISITVNNGALIEINGVQTGLSSATVSEFDLIRLYYITSAVPGEQVVFTVTLGTGDPVQWIVRNTGDFGGTPDSYTFGTDSTPTPGTLVTSTIILTVSGVTSPLGVPVYGTNGVAISINGGPFTVWDSPTNAGGPVFNGDTLQVSLISPAFAGFQNIASIFIGGGVGTFTVITSIAPTDPILGQWYSSLNVIPLPGVKFSTKFDGLPIGSMMPVFKENVNADSSSFGDLSGNPNSRFPGWIYCNGQMLFPNDYPALFEVLGYKYGIDFAGRFRLPDMRNKKLVGTGNVDGNVASSPALTPDFGPLKGLSNSRSFNNPGSHGGMWFIRTIDSPSEQVIPQVDEPAFGLPATDSGFFDVASIRTEGYENVTGQVDFFTTGTSFGNISLGETQIFEVPFHTHELLSGVADPAFKGRVAWNSFGGYNNDIPATSRFGAGSPVQSTYNVQLNLWGFAVTNIDLDRDDTVETSNNVTEDMGTVWTEKVEAWTIAQDPGYLGLHITERHNAVRYIQSGLRESGSNYAEISSYIDIDNTPFPGASSSDPFFKWVGAVDIPTREISVKQFRPIDRLKHTHYLTFDSVGGRNDKFSYGNSNGFGTAYGDTPSTTFVTVQFDSQNIGLEVLPGVFKLDSSKQLIPTPSFQPQETVGLITEYTWVKWVIKAF